MVTKDPKLQASLILHPYKHFKQIMEHMKAGVLSKFKSVISVIYGIFLGVTKLSSSPKPFPPLHHLQLGLGALTFSSAQKFFSSSSSFSLSSSSTSSTSSSSSWSSTVGDLIGTESGVYISSNEEKLLGEVDKTKPFINNLNQRPRNKRIGTKREKNYPPPIPSLARTGYLTGRMPWVLTRRYVNGRLILKEERVNRYEYFEVHRENGRLILNLILLDNTIGFCRLVEEKNEDIDELVEVDNGGERNDRDDEQKKKQDEVEDPVKEKGSRILLSCSRNEGDIRRCFPDAGTAISTSGFFGIPMVQVTKPVDA